LVVLDNILALQYNPAHKTSLQFGRMMLSLDDMKVVGSVSVST